MALTQKDLLSISQLLDAKLEEKLEVGLAPIKKDIHILKKDVGGLKEDVNVLKKDVSGLKEDVNVLKKDVSGLKEDVNVLKEEVSSLQEDMTSVKGRLRRIEVDLLENNVIPRLDTIERCYVDTYNRYQTSTDKMEEAFADIDTLKKVVTNHSEQLQKIS